MDYKKKLEELGYVVTSGKYGNSTEIMEPAQSLVSKKIHFIEVAFSSKKDDNKFMEEVYNSLTV